MTKKNIKIKNKIKISNKKKRIYTKRAIIFLGVLLLLGILKFSIGSITYSGRYKKTMQDIQKGVSEEYGEDKSVGITEEYKKVKIKYVHPDFKDANTLNMIKNDMKSKAYETVDKFPKDKKQRSLAVIYRGSSITDKIISYAVEQKIYVKKGSNIELESDMNDPQTIIDTNTGESKDISSIFIDGLDPMPSIKQKTKNAIMETKTIELNKIGSIGSWEYPDDVIGAGIKLSSSGITIPVNDPNKNIDSVTIPLDQLANVLKPEFLGEEKRAEMNAISKKKEAEVKMVALTFNDSSNKEDISSLLDILNKNKVSATLYVQGENIEKNASLIKKFSKSGHEIGNRSWSQKNMTEIKPSTIYQDVLKTDFAIFNQTGKFPETFRPPYAAINTESAKSINHPISIWSIDSGDWITDDDNKIFLSVTESVRDGDIVLFNGSEKSTLKALNKIIPKLKKEGYEFVTVSELMNYKLYPGHAYHSTNTIVDLTAEEDE